MKKSINFLVLFIVSIINAQNSITYTGDLEEIKINKDVTTHIITSENIEYTDISTHNIISQLAKDNILAIRPTNEDLDKSVITIVCESYMKQFRLVYSPSLEYSNSNVYIDNNSAEQLTGLGYKLTNLELNKIARELRNQKPSFRGVASKNNGMIIRLNNIYTNGNYFFIDYTVNNQTNINYSVDLIKYKIVDRKITKSTTSQEIEIKPITDINKIKHFSKQYKNIVVFDKFTIPDNKTFVIEFAEKQISGRKLELYVSYKDLLNAKLIK